MMSQIELIHSFAIISAIKPIGKQVHNHHPHHLLFSFSHTSHNRKHDRFLKQIEEAATDMERQWGWNPKDWYL